MSLLSSTMRTLANDERESLKHNFVLLFARPGGTFARFTKMARESLASTSMSNLKVKLSANRGSSLEDEADFKNLFPFPLTCPCRQISVVNNRKQVRNDSSPIVIVQDAHQEEGKRVHR
eukprot:scpid75323/ scgid7432/ 